jgi:hypothetical protein
MFGLRLHQETAKLPRHVREVGRSESTQAESARHVFEEGVAGGALSSLEEPVLIYALSGEVGVLALVHEHVHCDPGSPNIYGEVVAAALGQHPLLGRQEGKRATLVGEKPSNGCDACQAEVRKLQHVVLSQHEIVRLDVPVAN